MCVKSVYLLLHNTVGDMLMIRTTSVDSVEELPDGKALITAGRKTFSVQEKFQKVVSDMCEELVANDRVSP